MHRCSCLICCVSCCVPSLALPAAQLALLPRPLQATPHIILMRCAMLPDAKAVALPCPALPCLPCPACEPGRRAKRDTRERSCAHRPYWGGGAGACACASKQGWSVPTDRGESNMEKPLADPAPPSLRWSAWRAAGPRSGSAAQAVSNGLLPPQAADCSEVVPEGAEALAELGAAAARDEAVLCRGGRCRRGMAALGGPGGG